MWDPRRSRLSLQKREVSNHNYKKNTVGSYQVGSGIESSSVGSFQFLGRIKSGQVVYRIIFGFRVVSNRVGLGIESSIIGSFQILGCIGSGIRSSIIGSFWVSDRIISGRVEYQVVQYRIISDFESY
jgi:hypothetical protein